MAVSLRHPVAGGLMINPKSKLASVQNAGPPCLPLLLAPLVLNPPIRENGNDPLNSWAKLAECQIDFPTSRLSGGTGMTSVCTLRRWIALDRDHHLPCDGLEH